MLRLTKQQYDYLQNLLEPRTFNHLKCVNCGYRFKHREKYFHIRFMPSHCVVCDNCKSIASLFVDFDLKGSREPEKRSWSWMRNLALLRDDVHCRLCGKPAIEVHHIIPKNHGGTHNLKNLISLCKRCHNETFKQGYGGIEITEKLILEGKQQRLVPIKDNNLK